MKLSSAFTGLVTLVAALALVLTLTPVVKHTTAAIQTINQELATK